MQRADNNFLHCLHHNDKVIGVCISLKDNCKSRLCCGACIITYHNTHPLKFIQQLCEDSDQFSLIETQAVLDDILQKQKAQQIVVPPDHDELITEMNITFQQLSVCLRILQNREINSLTEDIVVQSIELNYQEQIKKFTTELIEFNKSIIQKDDAGCKFIGEFNVFLTGKGGKLMPDGTEYTNATFKNGKAYGECQIKFPNGDYYNGHVIEDQFNRKGKFTCLKENYCYEGDFKNNMRHGKGKITWQNKDEYEGEMYEDRISGQGQWKTQIEFYNGKFLNNNRHGYGKLLNLKTNNQYLGEFLNGQMNDQNGKYIWANGDIYEGNFKDNQIVGDGQITYKNHKKYISYLGQVSQGQPNGKGKYSFINGDSYEGEVLNGMLHGQGKYIWKNKNLYSGSFVNDQISGEGCFYFENKFGYKGTFNNLTRLSIIHLIYPNGDTFASETLSKQEQNSQLQQISPQIDQEINFTQQSKGQYITKDGIIYTGEFKLEKKTWLTTIMVYMDISGNGKIKWPNGDIYIGDLRYSVQDGEGIFKSKLFSYEGKYYKGKMHDDNGSITWISESIPQKVITQSKQRIGIKQNENTISQVKEQVDIAKYNGQFKYGFRSGKGKLELADGSIYEGNFEKDQKSGNGTLIYPNKDKYVGYFENDLKSGKGKFTWTNKDVYIGEFKLDKICGQGELTYANGDIYVGMFKEGKFEGQGTYNWQNDPKLIKYEGNYVNGIRQGIGQLYMKDGSYYEGQFHENQIHGQGKLTISQTEEYDGSFNLGRKNGNGTLTIGNQKFVGFFLDDQINGQGVIETQFGTYEGLFDMGKMEGNGVITTIKGDKYKGVFSYDFINNYEITISGQAKCIYENGQYEGFVVNGFREVQGTYKWKTGSKYEGEWLKGDMCGQGTYIWANGDIYNGGYKNGFQLGKGIKKWKNGDIYKGEWLKDKMYGQGTMKWADGNIYIGGYDNDFQQGKGTFKWENGDKYEGEWLKGKKFGQGTMKWSNGNIYQGGYDNDFQQGKGTFKWENGDKYEGEWLKGKKSGQGTMKWSNGNIYIGGYDNDFQQGKGTFKWKNGDKYKGEFVEDEKCGYGTYTWADKNQYTGKFENDQMHGIGKYQFTCGIVYEGEFTNDEMTGKGIMRYPNGPCYKGTFIKGEKQVQMNCHIQ